MKETVFLLHSPQPNALELYMFMIKIDKEDCLFYFLNIFYDFFMERKGRGIES